MAEEELKFEEVKVPIFTILSSPTITLRDIKTRRFRIIHSIQTDIEDIREARRTGMEVDFVFKKRA